MSVRKVLFIVALLGVGLRLEAVSLRIVTYNIEAKRNEFGGVTDALNNPGTTDYDAVRDSLLRISADVVCLQEIANDDVANRPNSSLDSLATELGLPHIHIASRSGAFDSGLQNVILSRFPFLATDDIGSADYLESIGAVGSDGEIAREFSRAAPAVSIDVPGAATPLTVCCLHAKSGVESDDPFRRAVEYARIRDYLQRNGLGSPDHVVVLGDFNLSSSSQTFSSEPAGLPWNWNRGTDIPLPLTYSTDPDFYFPSPFNLFALDARDVTGDDATFRFGRTIDFILPSPGLTTIGSEVYRSDRDTSNLQGLAKFGSPLPSETSFDASDHYPVFADFELADLETSYRFRVGESEISESFSAFLGQRNPAKWTSAGAEWAGSFLAATRPSQSSAFAYVVDEDRSLGLIAGPSGTVLTANFRNETGETITALEVTYLARQLASSRPTSSDVLTITLTAGSQLSRELPALGFQADANLSSDLVETLSATVSNFSCPDDEEFQLNFTLEKGSGNGTASEEVFLNEIHYEDTGSDEGEFIEIGVGPGFAGDVATIEIVLYNGSASQRKPYGSHLLGDFDNFAAPTVVNGYRIYSKLISGLQNGGEPDGLAIVVDAEVTQFISYEGTFTALEGPAAGLTSIDIGVSQSTSTPDGFASLGLTGNGLSPADFSWTEFTNDVPHSPGQPNAGQTFLTPSPLLTLDDLRVRIVTSLDSDGDGTPDAEDRDDDNDGLPDLVEVALGLDPLSSDSDGNGVLDGQEDFDHDGQDNFSEATIVLTDPADASSRFETVLTRTHSGALRLSFPTLVGRRYEIFDGDSLPPAQGGGEFAGSGSDYEMDLVPTSASKQFLRVNVRLATE